jgi:alkylation response protein AidB-like acyl-CoA dehydrogenase
MEFNLDTIQLMTQKSMREFVRKELVPLGRDIDERAEFPMRLYRQTVDLGVLDMTLSEDRGGSGTDFLSFIIALEEFAYGNAGLANMIALTELIVHLMSRYGSETLQDRYISRLVNADTIGTLILNSDGSESADPPIRAVSKEKNYLLNGSARYLAAAPLADMALVFAPDNEERLSIFALDTTISGVIAGKPAVMMGQRSLPIGDLTLANVMVPPDSLLGDPGQGPMILNRALSRLRTATATIAVGVAQAAFEEAARYSKQRVQFGKALSTFDATRNKIADIAVGVAASRLLVYQAACAIDKGKKPEKPSAMAKLFASDLAAAVSKEAVQIHGGCGYVKDYAVERLYRDAVLTQIYTEANDAQRLQIAGQVFGEIK